MLKFLLMYKALNQNRNFFVSAINLDENPNLIVGYFQNWIPIPNSGFQKGTPSDVLLKDIPKEYAIIPVGFMKTQEGETIPTFKPNTMNDEEFISQVSALKEEGRIVPLSLGGAFANILLEEKDEKAFTDEIIKTVEKYGFQGMDIDIEDKALNHAPNAIVIPNAVLAAKEYFKSQNKDFLITLAPEFIDLKTDGGRYIPYLEKLEGNYDYVSPQFYNQGDFGINVDGVGKLGQSDQSKKEDFIYYISKSIINGERGFYKIPANKLVFGLPANNDAGLNGYVENPNDLINAMKRLASEGNKLKGLMTWSVNWDGGTDVNGKNYDYEFIKRYSNIF